MANTRGVRKLSEEQVDQIIELRTRMVSEKETARTVGCAVNTVRKHWNDYLDTMAPIRAANRDRHRMEMIDRLDLLASESMVRALNVLEIVNDDGDTAHVVVDGANKWGAIALKAMSQQALLGGYNAPTEVADVTPPRTPDEARAMLGKLTDKERKRLGL